MKAPDRILFAALLATGLAAGATAAPTAQKPAAEQASIPFVNHGSIRDWKADKRDGLWIQDNQRQWYYAKTLGPCTGLDFAQSIGFDTARTGTLDRFGTVVVPRESRCPIVSLTRSEAPPTRQKQSRDAAAETEVEG